MLRVHLLRGQRHRGDGRVEIDAAVGRDLVARDHETGPRLDRAECAPLDAWHLHEAGDRIAGHAEVMLQRRLGGVGDHLMAEVVRLCDERRAHSRRDADLRLAAAFGARASRCACTVADRRGGEESIADLVLRQIAAAFAERVDQRGQDPADPPVGAVTTR